MKRISLYILSGIVLALAVGLGSAGAAAAASPNLLANPSLEQADSTGRAPLAWTYGSWGTGVTASGTWLTDAHTGTYSARVDITKYPTSSTGGDVGDAKWLPDPVAVTAGAYYTYSDWYKANRSSAISVEYWTASQLDANGQPTDDGTWANLFSGLDPKTDWTQYQTGFTMPAGAVYATFAHFIYGVGWLQIDDAAMAKQPTPPGFSSPMVSLTFDDGSAGFYKNGWPIVQAHNFKTTQYIPTGTLSTDPSKNDPDMMTVSQLSTMATHGQEIGGHSVTHPYLTTVTPDSALDKELVASKAFLEKNVAGAGTVTDFAYPYGDYDARVIAREQAAGYVSGRSVEEGYVSKLDLAPYDLRVQNILSTTTVAEFESWVDYAKAHNYWLIVVFHEVQPDNGTLGDYDTTVSKFSQMLNYLDSAGVTPVTVRDGFQSATAQINAPQPGSVKITPAAPTTNQTLTATPSGFTDPNNKTFTYNYQWMVNGTPVTGATSQTFDLSQTGHGDHGDKIEVNVTAKNTAGQTSTGVSDEVTVADTPPTAGSVSITPQAPVAGTALTATPSEFTDVDGDQLSYSYSWTVNGQLVSGVTGETLPASAVVGGTVAVQVTASDGHSGTSPAATASVRVIGHPVAGTVTISPSNPTTNQTVSANASGFSDPLDDTLTYSYQWLVNGTTIQDATGNTLDLSQAGHSANGDQVQVKVKATNSHGLASDEVSDTVTVGNTPPSGGSVAITPSNPKAGADLTATPTGFADADGDQLSYEYTWLENGQPIAVGTGNILPGTWVLAGKVTVQVTAVDPKGDKSPVASASVDVAPATTTGGGGTPAPGTGPGSASTPAAGTGLGSDSTPAAGTGHSAGGAPLGIVVSNPSRPFYRLGQSLVVRYSCSAGSGIASCVATLGLPGAKPVPMTSGKKVQLSKTGRYVLRITATDHKGSTQTTTVYFRVTSDRNAPAIVISSPKGRTYRLGQSLVVRFSCSDGSGVAGCSGTLGRVGGRPSRVSAGSRVPLTTRGRYVLRISARDGVGNADSRTLPFSVK